MASLDIFESDAFGLTSLTAAINEFPDGEKSNSSIDYLFQEQGVNTTTVYIERQDNELVLVQSAPRGGVGSPTNKGRRNVIPFMTTHLPVTSGVNADEVQSVRAFGGETELDSVMNLVNRQLLNMRGRIEATIQYHRITALNGIVLDADGGTLLDIFTTFGVSQQTQQFTFSSATTDVRNVLVAAMRKAEDEIGDGGMITGWRAICGRNWFDAFIAHSKVQAAYVNWNAAPAVLTTDLRKTGFSFTGVEFSEYYGKVGSSTFLDPDVAFLVPIVDGLLITRYSPADYMETVNSTGLPLYAKQELRAFNKGVDLEAQSNPLNLCTRPRAIIKLTKN